MKLPDQLAVSQPINNDPEGKNVLSMSQFSADDIAYYIREAEAAERVISDPERGGLDLLKYKVLKTVMRQPSTRTAGSMTTAMAKLGGFGDLISGMKESSESKGETVADSWIAFATQADIIGTRMAENEGPTEAARAITAAVAQGNLGSSVPVINLGDGKNEHPTQALGDLFTIYKEFDQLRNIKLAMVGDHERYRAFHSLFIGAAAVGMQVIAVQAEIAPVPAYYKSLLGDNLQITDNLDGAMEACDVLYLGRNPDEYTGEEESEKIRSRELNLAYANWIVSRKRLEQMEKDAIVLHPRPRGAELAIDTDGDPRTRDVKQMSNMIPMRMAIIANALGKSITEAV